MKRLEARNLFLTRTALGVYITIIGLLASTAAGLAHKYDEAGRLKVTDWVLAGCGLVFTLSGQSFVMGAKVGGNGAFTYTPRGVWGPNKEDVVANIEEFSAPSLPPEEVPQHSPSTFPVERVPESRPDRFDGYRPESRPDRFDGYRGE